MTTPPPFEASVQKYTCIDIDPEDAKILSDAVSHHPGQAIPKIHCTLVHSNDAVSNEEAMAKWNKVMELVSTKQTVTVTRYKQKDGFLTAAEAVLDPALAPLVASGVPHISLRLEPGVKAVESRFVLPDESVPWTVLPAPILLKGTVALKLPFVKKKKGEKEKEKETT